MVGRTDVTGAVGGGGKGGGVRGRKRRVGVAQFISTSDTTPYHFP